MRICGSTWAGCGPPIPGSGREAWRHLPDSLFASVNITRSINRVPVVLFEHHVEYLTRKQLSDPERNLLKKARFEIRWRRLRRKEIELCRRFDLTITVSEEDRECLRKARPATCISRCTYHGGG